MSAGALRQLVIGVIGGLLCAGSAAAAISTPPSQDQEYAKPGKQAPAAQSVPPDKAQPPPVSADTEALAGIRKLIDQGHYPEAVSAARLLLAQVEDRHGPNSVETAQVLDLLVEGLLRASGARNQELAGFVERAVAIKEKTLGPNHPDVASSLMNLGRLLSDQGDYASARRALERAQAIWESARGPDDPAVARALNNLGILLTVAEDYVTARAKLERSLAILEKAYGPNHLLVGMCLANLANVYRWLGDFARAMPLYERALVILEKTRGPDHPYVATVLENLGGLEETSENFQGARARYEQALAIREKILGPDSPTLRNSLNSLCEVHYYEGNYGAAKSLCEHALALSEQTLDSDPPGAAGVLENLGRVLAITGDYAGAIKLFRRGLAIREKAFGPDHVSLTWGLSPLAETLAASGDNSEALTAALQAERIGREHIRYTIQSLPERQALAYASWRASGLGVALTLTATPPNASVSAKRAVWDALIRSRGLVLNEIAERRHSMSEVGDPEVARLAQDVSSAREQLAHLVVRGLGDDPADVYRSRVDSARSAKETAERALAEKSAAFRVEQARGRLGLADVAGALPSNGALVGFVKYGLREFGQKPSGKPPEPVASYLAFVLRSGETQPQVVPLGTAKELEPLITAWRVHISQEPQASAHALKRSEAVYRSAAAKLRREVWDPVAAHLRGVQRVFIVPDGALNLVNFAALPVGQSGYLIESGPLIHYLTAERDLVPVATQTKNEGLLALGAPAFDEKNLFAALVPERNKSEGSVSAQPATTQVFRGQRSVCGQFQSLRFEPLPASAREAERIVALWQRADGPGRAPTTPMRSADSSNLSNVIFLSGAAASEAAFKQQAPGKRVLHLATHGFFLGGGCASALDAPRLAGAAQPVAATGENPLLLSGLALAGANNRKAAGADEEDGVLTAEEIASLDLDGVEWAVLSACNTGVGEVKAGEGVFGLRRAFQVAGAKTVIMSLWPVEDQAARTWMTSLYRHRFLQGRSTADSVRAASLDVLRQRRAKHLSTHPFSWAGFVAAGDWR